MIILDLSEASGDSESFLSDLKTAYIDISVIVLHLYHQKTFADAFLKMRASAYLPVHFHTEDLFPAIEHVLSNKAFVGRNVS